jgi:hypothetical protein
MQDLDLEKLRLLLGYVDRLLPIGRTRLEEGDFLEAADICREALQLLNPSLYQEAPADIALEMCRLNLSALELMATTFVRMGRRDLALPFIAQIQQVDEQNATAA